MWRIAENFRDVLFLLFLLFLRLCFQINTRQQVSQSERGSVERATLAVVLLGR